MENVQHQRRTATNLEKLGIRQINERIEVSPILTDPGTVGLNVEDTTPKSYVCTINLENLPSRDGSIR